MNPVSNHRTHRIPRPWSLELRPWPFWSQLNDWTPEGDDNNAANNCGPESVAMCLRYLTGVGLPAAHIKNTMKGEGYTGFTDVPDIEGYLQNYCETGTTTILTTSAENQAWWEWRFLSRGRPLIGLFWSDVGGIGVGGHFRVVIGVSAGHAVTADPWTGTRRVETRQDHWAWSKGLLIGLNRKRMLGDR